MVQGAHCITWLKRHAKLETLAHFSRTDTVRDRLVRLGSGQNRAPILTVRVVKVRFGRQCIAT